MSYKASVLSRDLAARLRIRLGSALTVTESTDVADEPVITISDGAMATNEQSVLIRIKAEENIGKTSVGTDLHRVGPHAVQIVMEAQADVDGSVACAVVTAANQLPILAEALRLGAKVELYLSPNGTVPAVAEIKTDNLKATYDDLFWPFLATV